MTQVPLVVYGSTRERIVIGTADIEMVDGEVVIIGNITKPNAKHISRDENLDEAEWDYSVCFSGGVPIEAVQYPIAAVPKINNVFDKE